MPTPLVQQSDTWGYRLFLIIFTLIIVIVFTINAVDYLKIYNQWKNSPEINQGVSQNLALTMGLLNIFFAIVSGIMFLYNAYRLWYGPAKPSTDDDTKKTSWLEKPASGISGSVKKGVGKLGDGAVALKNFFKPPPAGTPDESSAPVGASGTS